MQHLEASIQIYATKDYSLFSFKKGNRDLNLNKIERIKSDIRNGIDMLKYCPIVVQESKGKLEILDGQHRFQVCRDLKCNVFYVIYVNNIRMVDIAKVNSNTEKWNADDFIKCYAQHGMKDYEVLADFRTKYGFPISVCLRLLFNGKMTSQGGTPLKEDFEAGTFKAKHYAEAAAIADNAILFNSSSFYKSGAFVAAINRIMEAGLIDVTELAKKYEKNPEKLKQQANWKDYITNLEQIYNIGLHKRETII